MIVFFNFSILINPAKCIIAIGELDKRFNKFIIFLENFGKTVSHNQLQYAAIIQI